MDENEAITKEDFYSAYVMYCKSSNLPMVTMTTIGRNLPQVIPTIRQGDKIMVGDKRKTAWRGIRLRGENETSEDAEPPKGDKTPPEPPKEMQLKLNIGDDRPESLKRFQTLDTRFPKKGEECTNDGDAPLEDDTEGDNDNLEEDG